MDLSIADLDYKPSLDEEALTKQARHGFIPRAMFPAKTLTP